MRLTPSERVRLFSFLQVLFVLKFALAVCLITLQTFYWSGVDFVVVFLLPIVYGAVNGTVMIFRPHTAQHVRTASDLVVDACIAFGLLAFQIYAWISCSPSTPIGNDFCTTGPFITALLLEIALCATLLCTIRPFQLVYRHQMCCEEDHLRKATIPLEECESDTEELQSTAQEKVQNDENFRAVHDIMSSSSPPLTQVAEHDLITHDQFAAMEKNGSDFHTVQRRNYGHFVESKFGSMIGTFVANLLQLLHRTGIYGLMGLIWVLLVIFCNGFLFTLYGLSWAGGDVMVRVLTAVFLVTLREAICNVMHRHTVLTISAMVHYTTFTALAILSAVLWTPLEWSQCNLFRYTNCSSLQFGIQLALFLLQAIFASLLLGQQLWIHFKHREAQHHMTKHTDNPSHNMILCVIAQKEMPALSPKLQSGHTGFGLANSTTKHREQVSPFLRAENPKVATTRLLMFLCTSLTFAVAVLSLIFIICGIWPGNNSWVVFWAILVILFALPSLVHGFIHYRPLTTEHVVRSMFLFAIALAALIYTAVQAGGICVRSASSQCIPYTFAVSIFLLAVAVISNGVNVVLGLQHEYAHESLNAWKKDQ